MDRLAAISARPWTLLRMQAWYDSHTMRQRAGEIDLTRHEPA